MGSIAIYVHIPFCAKHCAYCDFNTYVEKSASSIVREIVDAICLDIERSSGEHVNGVPLSERTVETIFFGGGTPTFLTGEQLTRILNVIRSSFNVAADAEISSEANPGSSDAEKFAAMRATGFNRLSLGVQSFDDLVLNSLDRFHTANDAVRAVNLAREAGFDNLSLDLMFRLPNQTLALWNASLQRAIELAPEHLSLYSLTLEPGTRFERLHRGGKLPLPDEETELAMYEGCIDTLEAAGYEHYEVSNFAKPNHRCRHNLTYWHNEEYLGVGPGAVSYVNGRRWKRERLPARYVAKLNANADLTVESECLDPNASLGETIMLGLRLREGISIQELEIRYHINLLERYATEIERHTNAGLLEQVGPA